MEGYVPELLPGICRYDGVTGVRTRLVESNLERIDTTTARKSYQPSRHEWSTRIQCVERLYKH